MELWKECEWKRKCDKRKKKEYERRKEMMDKISNQTDQVDASGK